MSRPGDGCPNCGARWPKRGGGLKHRRDCTSRGGRPVGSKTRVAPSPNWGGRRVRKSGSQCRVGELWCGLPRAESYKAGLPRGIAILVSYEPDGTERVFCSGNCVEKWRPVGADPLLRTLGSDEWSAAKEQG